MQQKVTMVRGNQRKCMFVPNEWEEREMGISGKWLGRGSALILAVAAWPAAAAVESLGNDTADKLAAELQAKEPDTELTCKFVGDIITCGGAKIGTCMALRWQVNHDGTSCRKNINDAQ
jgi:hypothetical protein